MHVNGAAGPTAEGRSVFCSQPLPLCFERISLWWWRVTSPTPTVQALMVVHFDHIQYRPGPPTIFRTTTFATATSALFAFLVVLVVVGGRARPAVATMVRQGVHLSSPSWSAWSCLLPAQCAGVVFGCLQFGGYHFLAIFRYWSISKCEISIVSPIRLRPMSGEKTGNVRGESV